MKMVLEWIRKETGVVRTTLGVDRGSATIKSGCLRLDLAPATCLQQS